MIITAAEEILATTFQFYQRASRWWRLQAESGVLIDMACRLGVRPPDVLTIDTGRLPDRAYAVIDEFRSRYDIRLRVLTPDPDDVRQLIAVHGPRPLSGVRRAAAQLLRRAWNASAEPRVARVRRVGDRAAPRSVGVPCQHPDGGEGRRPWKASPRWHPLVGWTRADVEIERNSVPRHPLYAAGYTSIGCAPCTRATTAGEDERAGRWWWEQDSNKECGLHVSAPQERA